MRKCRITILYHAIENKVANAVSVVHDRNVGTVIPSPTSWEEDCVTTLKSVYVRG